MCVCVCLGSSASCPPPLRPSSLSLQDAFEVLAESYEFNDIQGSCVAFRRAASVLKSLPWALTRMGDIQGLPCLGPHSQAVIEVKCLCSSRERIRQQRLRSRHSDELKGL